MERLDPLDNWTHQRLSEPLLLCGVYTTLQETRAEVLRLAGFSVETVSCPQEVRDRLEQKHYELLLLCHSLGQADIDSLTETAARAGVLTYQITALTPAEVLIHDTEALVRSRPEQGEVSTPR